jgi:hypothetical protein
LVSNLPDKSTRVIIAFSDKSHLYFNDQRKFVNATFAVNPQAVVEYLCDEIPDIPNRPDGHDIRNTIYHDGFNCRATSSYLPRISTKTDVHYPSGTELFIRLTHAHSVTHT